MTFDVAAALREHAAELDRYYDALFARLVSSSSPFAGEGGVRGWDVPVRESGPNAEANAASAPKPLPPPPRARGRGEEPPSTLIEAIRYSLGGGGKRLRPALVLEAFAAVAAPGADRSAAVAAAAAMELVHTFSLVHDDLPAMDDDDLRRGRPTNHKVFGEATAILAGDAMMTLAFEILARAGEPPIAVQLVAELGRAAGPCGMIGGQILDMAAEGRDSTLPQLVQIHRMKTAALLSASVRMGAIAGNGSADRVAALGVFGREIGLAFQITDDLLDETATAQQLGKATQKDARRGKTTYPRLLGLDGSRAAADKHTRAAIDALSPLDSRGDRLASIARFILDRSH